MHNLENYKFNPKIDHISVGEYDLMAKPTTDPVKYKKAGSLKIATIPKENLGVGRYQRTKINHARIKSIREQWHPELGNANVCELEHRGKYYYQLVDGQHRSCASPSDSIDCIITNSHVPVDNFLMANDPKTTKPISDDDSYWAKYIRWETVNDEKSKNDDEDVKFIHTLFVKHGWTPSRNYGSANKNFGSTISKLHKVYTKQVVNFLNRLEKANKVTAEEAKEKRRVTLSDCMEIMIRVFGADTFTSQTKHLNAWAGLMKFLSRHKDFDYSVDNIVEALSQGRWCRYAKGPEREERLERIKDWKMVTGQYVFSALKRSGKLTDVDAWYQTFVDVYKVSSR